MIAGNSYFDLIEQTFDWPALSFSLEEKQNLIYEGLPLKDIAKEYGTPLKITYLPKIGQQINKAVKWFNESIKKLDYQGNYTYCYCTKSSHFSFVLDEVLNNNAHLETSSGYDMDIIKNLYQRKKIDKSTYIICNGFKRQLYIENIVHFIEGGFENIIPILDNLEELDQYLKITKNKFKVGIRIASEEEPNFEFYTSRLGIRYKDIVPFYKEKIKDNNQVELKMLHFFINTGIRDDIYYWNELTKCVNIYCDLKEICPELDSFDIGGGFPVPNSLAFDYDYPYMIQEVLRYIKYICDERKVPTPNIFTEFGSYTVAESGINLYGIMGKKQQNDSETWYMIDSSFITTLPDSWGIGQRFILLGVNHWDQEYQRVNLGGLTCDSMDYYNSEVHMNQVFLPKFPENDPLIVGFFNTGAYQESLSGYGGIKHCLIPSPKHIVIDRKENEALSYRVFSEEQSSESMMKILGYI